MGATASIIDGESILSSDYNKLRKEEWGEGNITNSVRRKRAVYRNSGSSIQSLAVNQLSSTIKTNRTSKPSKVTISKSTSIDECGVPTRLADTSAQYSRSMSNISVNSVPRKSQVFAVANALLSPISEERDREGRHTGRTVSFQPSPTSELPNQNSSRSAMGESGDSQDKHDDTYTPKGNAIDRITGSANQKSHVIKGVAEGEDEATHQQVERKIAAFRRQGTASMKNISGDDSQPPKATPASVPPLALGETLQGRRRVNLTIRAADSIEESLATDQPVNDDPPLVLKDNNASSLLYRRKSKLLKVAEADEPLTSEDQETHRAVESKAEPSASESNVRLSPGGSTVYVGRWKIKESGLQHTVSGAEREMDTTWRGKDSFLEIGALGSGASGTVVEALHLPTLTIVALKILPVHNPKKNHHLAQELAVLYKNLTDLRLVDSQRLSSSAIIANSAPCPFVLSLYDAFVDTRSSKINLVMEFMDGGSLQDLVRNGGTRDERVLADISYQVIKGLEYLHAQKQMHRDIKPGNILLNCKGVVKVADFGISKAMDNTFGCAKSFVGTMCYMAPERIVAKNYGFPADIWSFGLTLLTVALGEFPLPEKDQGFWGLMNTICDGDPPSAGPDFSDTFNSFIAACLLKDPRERFTPAQLLKHPFLDMFSMKAVSQSVLEYDPDTACSYDTPRPSSEQTDTTPRTLSELAASRNVDSRRRDSFDQVEEVRLEHLKHLLETLALTCVQRESADGSDEDDYLDSSGHDDGAHAPLPPMRPIRLPSIKGAESAKWRHLASQLHLPFETVVAHVSETIDARFLLPPVDEDLDESFFT